tara:strand:- start:276 stop:542 length:267 start_codon:yes stop_codon:yes gene_type:complete
MSNIDPEDLDSFKLPDSLLDTIFELSGDANQHKGFILAFVTQEGKPIVYTRSQNQIIEMGLRKSLEQYLMNLEESESLFGFGDIDPQD